jgi:DNA-binding MurR/RpiR family transcriptional regulator
LKLIGSAQAEVICTGGDLPQIWDRVVDESLERIELLRRGFSLESYSGAVQIILEARQTLSYDIGASTVSAEHLALKLRRAGHRARCIQSAGFRLADDLLDVEQGDAMVVFVPGRMLIDVEVLLD